MKKKNNENEMLFCHLSQVKAERGTTDIAFKEKLITSACISLLCSSPHNDLKHSLIISGKTFKIPSPTFCII